MDKVAANFYGHSLTIIIPLFILYISLRMHWSGHKEHLIDGRYSVLIKIYAGISIGFVDGEIEILYHKV